MTLRVAVKATVTSRKSSDTVNDTGTTSHSAHSKWSRAVDKSTVNRTTNSTVNGMVNIKAGANGTINNTFSSKQSGPKRSIQSGLSLQTLQQSEKQAAEHVRLPAEPQPWPVVLWTCPQQTNQQKERGTKANGG